MLSTCLNEEANKICYLVKYFKIFSTSEELCKLQYFNNFISEEIVPGW